MAEDDIIQVVAGLKERGVTCAKLKQLEKKSIRDYQNSLKDASSFRTLGFTQADTKQMAIANAEKSLAESVQTLRKKVCGLNK